MISSLLLTLLTPTAPQELLYKVPGNTGHSAMGWALDDIDDVDGDGIRDFVAGGPGGHTPPTESHLVGIFSGVDGSLVTGFYEQGAPNAQTGWAVAGMSDINRDDVPDWAVSNPWLNFIEFRSGVDSTVLVKFYSPTSTTHIGSSLCTIGDLTGDGIDEVVVGYPGTAIPEESDEGNENFDGRVWVVSGADGTLLKEIIGGTKEHGYGRFVESADVNGDGVLDLLIGSPDKWRMEIYSGADWSQLASITGRRKSQFGSSLDGMGDLNGDGCDEFVVGARGKPNDGRIGRAHLYDGKTFTEIETWLGDPADNMGWDICNAGDVNGDGFRDVLLGLFDPFGRPSGPVRLFSTKDSSLLYKFEFIGLGPTTWGTTVARAGDLNGDGFDDVWIGDSNHSEYFRGDLVGVVAAFAGNDVFLDAYPGTVDPGDTVNLKIGQAEAGALSLYVVEEVGGVLCFCPILGLEPLGADGFRRESVTVDASLSGITAQLRAYVLEPDGTLRDSGRESITVR